MVAPPIVTTEGTSVLAGAGAVIAGGEEDEEAEGVLELDEPPTLATLFLRPVNATVQVFSPPPIE